MQQSRLNSRADISKLDKSNVLGSIEALPLQIEDGWRQASLVELPESYKDSANIVTVAMGGSALGSTIIKHLDKQELTTPFEITHHYQLPGYVNDSSLVLLSSYSGSTEEVLAAAEDAKKRKAKIIVIAATGELLEFAKANNYPFYRIDPKHNPSNEPRMAVGYSLAGELAIFNNLGILQTSEKAITEVVTGLTRTAKNLNPDKVDNNTAKFLAYAAFHKIITLVSAEHLRGAVHVFNNQINENAKTLTIELELPELNHHYMEALPFPTSTKEDIIYFFFQSNFYHERVQKRVPLTLHITQQEGYQSELIQATAPTKLEQVFEIIQLGAFTNFYLAMLNGIDPAPIPNVDYFKSELSKLT